MSKTGKKDRVKIDPNVPREFHYNMAVSNPRAWLLMAQKLRTAAEKIDVFQLNDLKSAMLDHPELYLLFPVRQFLIGLSFENLIKGAIVSRGIPVKAGKGLAQWFTTHDLQPLIETLASAGYKLPKQDRRHLIRFKKYVLWIGHYPIPKRAVDYKLEDVVSRKDNREQMQLWDRLAHEIEQRYRALAEEASAPFAGIFP